MKTSEPQGSRTVSPDENAAQAHQVRATVPILNGVRAIVLLLLMSGSLAQAQYSFVVTPGVSSVNLLNASGESQSAVIPPGLKSHCPAGRLFISMDQVTPPQTGAVVGVDLDSSAQLQSTFEPDPDVAHDKHLTSDHDLIGLPNGDLLLLWGIHIDAPLTPKPAWFDFTYHDTFGPGVRRGTAVYRSTDCGQSFQYVSKIDPATLDDGRCAFPQPWKPPSPSKFWNGGSDGQLAKLSGGKLYLTMGCPGFVPDPFKAPFGLGPTPVNRTYVLQSTDEGTSWTNLGFTTFNSWRMGIESLPSGELAVASGLQNFLILGHSLDGTYIFDPTAIQGTVPWGWPDAGSAPFQMVKANLIASTLLTRVPGSGILAMAYPANIKDSHNQSVDGYELFLFDSTTNKLSQSTPILPSSHFSGNYTLHAAAIDPGRGPILLYWIDVNGNQQRAKVMGRFIFGDGSFSQDFSVATTIDPTPAKSGGPILYRDYVFDVGTAWYGDYHTAGGYVGTGGPETFHYYPMWVQSDGRARYSHVSLTWHHIKHGDPSVRVSVKHPKWRKAPPRVSIGGELASKPEVVDEAPVRVPVTIK